MSSLLPLIAQFGSDGGHMGGSWGWLVVGAMVVMMGGMGWMMWSMMRKAKGDVGESHVDPVAILRRRYADGELSTEEFHERLKVIEDAESRR